MGAEITIDLVLQARAKMSDNKVHRAQKMPVVSEMDKQLPQEKIYIITQCFKERFTGSDGSTESSWKIVKLVFLRNPDAEPKKGIRSYRAKCADVGVVEVARIVFILRLEKEGELES